MEKTDNIFTEVFGPNSVHWHTDSDYNRVFLQAQQNYFNHLLRARGHVFLNEIHDALGLNRTTEGQLVGWLASNNGEIDFNVEQNDKVGTVKLTFNVDGIIYKDIEEE